MPNFTRLFAHRPAVYEAWLQLKDAISGSMDPRRYELVTMAAARNLRSSYCTLQHGKVLASRFLEPAQVRDVVLDHRNAGLDEVDVAVIQADPVLAELDPELRVVLTVGRPIAAGSWRERRGAGRHGCPAPRSRLLSYGT